MPTLPLTSTRDHADTTLAVIGAKTHVDLYRLDEHVVVRRALCLAKALPAARSASSWAACLLCPPPRGAVTPTDLPAPFRGHAYAYDQDTWVVIGAASLEHLDAAQQAVEAALPDGWEAHASRYRQVEAVLAARDAHVAVAGEEFAA